MGNPDQTRISLQLSEAYLEEIDRAIKHTTYKDRAHFIREAIREKLKSMKIDVPIEITKAPSREGVGGRPTHRNPTSKHKILDNQGRPNLHLNDPAVPENLAAVTRRPQESLSSPPTGVTNERKSPPISDASRLANQQLIPQAEAPDEHGKTS